MEQLEMMSTDTIAAVSTPHGVGGIAVVRISGPDAVRIAASAWKGRSLEKVASHTAHLGRYHATDGSLLDEAVATVFRAPASFTGEDVVEIAVHGSRWIQREIISDLIRRGVRSAGAGEFTRRAFMNGKLDLAQAEGVADLIASSSRAAHRMAVSQTRGSFSGELDSLRDRLTEFASLLELELDFSEEDVEFADRSALTSLAETIISRLDRLSASYASGSVLKEGVPVVIAGIPNAGKSSILNLLLGDDRAIVSDVPGTTRDSIEDTMEIDGILYRFVDTAGLRATDDKVEELGIERARRKMRDAGIVVWVIDSSAPLAPQIAERDTFRMEYPEVAVITLANKADLQHIPSAVDIAGDTQENVVRDIAEDTQKNVVGYIAGDTQVNRVGDEIIRFSAVTGEGLTVLKERLKEKALKGFNPDSEIMVTNARHYEALLRGGTALRRALDGITEGISADFIAQDVREALGALSEITGSITSDTLLHSIFSRFCIGK